MSRRPGTAAATAVGIAQKGGGAALPAEPCDPRTPRDEGGRSRPTASSPASSSRARSADALPASAPAPPITAPSHVESGYLSVADIDRLGRGRVPSATSSVATSTPTATSSTTRSTPARWASPRRAARRRRSPSPSSPGQAKRRGRRRGRAQRASARCSSPTNPPHATSSTAERRSAALQHHPTTRKPGHAHVRHLPRARAPSARSPLLGGQPDDTTLRRYLHGIAGVDAVGLEQRAAGLGTRSIKTTSKALGPRQDHRADRPHHPRRRRHPGKVRSLVAKALSPRCLRPRRPRVRRGLRLRRHGAVRGRGARRGARATPTSAASSASPPSPPPSPAAAPRSTIKLADTADAVAAGADEIDMVIDRGAFLAGRYGLVFDQIARGQGGVPPRGRHLRDPQGDPRDGRAQHLRQRAARVVARDPRGRRLHQDLHRQGAARGDPAGHAPHARGRARLAPAPPARRSA